MTPPLTLAIEVSNPSATGAAPDGVTPVPEVVGPSVALARGPLVLDQEWVGASRGRHGDDLMPAIDRMVRRAGHTPRDVSRVYVSIGPGGFTGLRVAVATAKAIGESIIARGGPRSCTVGVPTARVAALNHVLRRGDTDARPFAVALASKRDTAWLTCFDARGAPESGVTGHPGLLAAAHDLAHLHRVHALGVLIADQFLPGALRDAAAALGLAIEAPILSARACAIVASGLPGIDPACLMPMYPREPEAVTLWRARGRTHPGPA